MDSIKKIEAMTPDAATYFMDLALRYFCATLVHAPDTVGMVESYRQPFQTIATEFLAWDDRQMQKALSKLDEAQTMAIRAHLGIKDDDEGPVDWIAVENKINRQYGHYVAPGEVDL